MEGNFVILGVLLLFFLLLLLSVFLLSRKVAVLSAAYRSFMQGRDGASLESAFISLNQNLSCVESRLGSCGETLRELAEVLDTAVRGVGVVRFNAFKDTGSDLSFAVALLDAGENGVVLSSIYGREESRTYAKPVKAGRSPYQLSGEEQEAIRRAAAATRRLINRSG
ncbi:MAG: hypothetical protein DDT21_00833 [Syntrophomonadaceae bacterium]|nr:hypothetical protein [Bacillota bacterium]